MIRAILLAAVLTLLPAALLGCADTAKMQAEIDYTAKRIDTLEKLVARMVANDAKAAAALAESLRQLRLANGSGGGSEGGE